MLKIATPVSHLFQQVPIANKIIEHSDCLECRDHEVFKHFKNEELFHCEIEPIHPMKEKQFEYLKKVVEEKKDLKLISFHMASSYQRPLLKGGKFVGNPKSKKFSRNEMKELAQSNFKRIKEVVGDKITLCVENNNFYPTEAYEYIADPDFINEVVVENDLNFLFDIAHAKISAHNKGMTYEKYKAGLPLQKLIQIHICQYGIDENDQAYDAHEVPNEEMYKEIKDIINSYPSLKYLTVEYYKDDQKLIQIIQHLKKFIK